MEWVIDVDALMAEGAEMRHCVGSHQSSCLYGRSHVARVFGAEGGRATVEVRWEIPKAGEAKPIISLVEHKAAGNGAPPADCEATVKAFIALAPRLVDADGVGMALEARKGHLERRRGVPMPGWGREAIIASYAPCLARYGADLSAEAWAGRVMACPPPPEPSPWEGLFGPAPAQAPAASTVYDAAVQGDIPF